MYEPASTEWWLVPSGEWPAYRFAKLYCQWSDETQGTLFPSLHVEKGISNRAAYALDCTAAHRLAMDDEWQWCSFLSWVIGDGLTSVAEQITSVTGKCVQLRVCLRFLDNPCEYEPYALDREADEYRFVWDSTDKMFRLTDSQTPTNVFVKIKKRPQLDSVSSLLEAVADAEWVWVDCFLGVEIPVLENGQPSSELAWKPEQLWTQLLEPLVSDWWGEH